MSTADRSHGARQRQLEPSRTGPAGDQRRRSLQRLLTTAGVASSTLIPLVPDYARRSLSATQVSGALAAGFERLGATYVKLGQLAASAPGVVGEEFAHGMRGLLDNASPVAFPTIRDIVERELGRPLDEVFATFGETPMAAASMAVVHRAELRDGTPVAVKVLRPGIERVVHDDLSLLFPLVNELAAIAQTHDTRIAAELIAGLREQLIEETDLRNELAAMIEARTVLDALDEDLVVIPTPFPALCTTRVLTMEYLDGVAIDDLSAIEHIGVDPQPVLLALVRAWFASALCQGVFHGDVHAGNLLVLTDGRVAILDWGIVGRLDPTTHNLFSNIVAGALGDDDRWEPAAQAMLDQIFTADALTATGMTASDLAPVLRLRLGGMLTAPFSQINLTEMLDQPPIPDGGPERPSAVAAAHRFAQRRRRRSILEPGPNRPGFDRNLFLLMKQLAYFERYGKLYLGDLPLLHDPDVFRQFV